MKNFLVTGAASGLGNLIANRLSEDHGVSTVFSTDKEFADLSTEKGVKDAIVYVDGKIDVLINCAGTNYINWFEEIEESNWDDVMNINAKAIWMITKELLLKKKFNKPATIVNIVSNASHMPMTHSAAYNASKGAAHILTKQMARELKPRHDITVLGVSPNKLKGTGMSQYIDRAVCRLRGWTPEEAAEYQKKSLPAGEETDPKAVAEFIGFLLSTPERHKYLNGCIIPYGA